MTTVDALSVSANSSLAGEDAFRMRQQESSTSGVAVRNGNVGQAETEFSARRERSRRVAGWMDNRTHEVGPTVGLETG